MFFLSEQVFVWQFTYASVKTLAQGPRVHLVWNLIFNWHWGPNRVWVFGLAKQPCFNCFCHLIKVFNKSKIRPTTTIAPPIETTDGRALFYFLFLCEPEIAIKTFPTQFLLKLAVVVSFHETLPVPNSVFNDLFFQIVTCDFYLHLAHNLGSAPVTGQHINKVVTRKDQNKRENYCLKKCLPVVWPAVVVAVYSLEDFKSDDIWWVVWRGNATHSYFSLGKNFNLVSCIPSILLLLGLMGLIFFILHFT